ncbi:MAG TPA: Ig-like domain-containing protein [Longimicrobium sp.]|nr:Ig-like domain-containing protein [Longimicrobium sp.]
MSIAACSDTRSPTEASPRAPRATGFCSGVVSWVSVTAPSSMNVGTSDYAFANATDTNGCAVSGGYHTTSWYSSNASVVSVSPYGYLTANAAGTATIYATVDGVTGSASVQVVVGRHLATLTLTPNPGATAVGTNAYFTATGKDQFGLSYPTGTITWTSSNPAVATINSSTGVATGVSRGSVTITATSGSVTATAPLTIFPYLVTNAPDYVYEGSFTVSSLVNPQGTYYYSWYERVCTNGESCTGYSLIAQGYNVTSVTRVMSRYDSSRYYRVELRDAPGGPQLNVAVAVPAGGNEMNPGGSCFPALEC